MVDPHEITPDEGSRVSKDDSADVEPVPPVAARPWYRSPRVLLPLAAVLVAAVGALITMLVIGRPGTFTLHGSFDLKRTGATSYGTDGCKGFRAYDDIHSGATVTVYDSTGQVVALGALGQGTLSNLVCRFPLVVENVPLGSSNYTVEISRRGKLTYPADEVETAPIALSLG